MSQPAMQLVSTPHGSPGAAAGVAAVAAVAAAAAAAAAAPRRAELATFPHPAAAAAAAAAAAMAVKVVAVVAAVVPCCVLAGFPCCYDLQLAAPAPHATHAPSLHLPGSAEAGLLSSGLEPSIYLQQLSGCSICC